MKPQVAHDFLLASCLKLFPSQYNTPEARAMVIAIGLQESDFKHRQQLIGNHRNWWQSLSGPAVSYWQFERIGIRGVLEHRITGPLIRVVLDKLGYPADVETIYKALIHNDILAVCFARLLLFTVPDPLPTRTQPAKAWEQYLWAWRPGKPKPDRWNERFAAAWEIVGG
ncbi:MAG: hypothetical protein Q8L20_10845 [Gammaproteobacteria bacterium]|nr:hypothetical protein [Gammaproteobacteria bacterium]